MTIFKQLSQYLFLAGIPGLLAVALIDTVAMPIVGGPEGLIILLTLKTPAKFLLIAFAATIGSTLGGVILYRVARAGGVLAMARMTQEKQRWIAEKIQHRAFLTVFVAALLPPPTPVKPVIIAAGVFRMPMMVFAAAVFAGRFLRYGITAYLGVKFGAHGGDIIKVNYSLIFAVTALALLALALCRLLPRCKRKL